MKDQPPPHHSLCFERPFPMRFHGGPWDGVEVRRKRAPAWMELRADSIDSPEMGLDPVQTIPIFTLPSATYRAQAAIYERRATPAGPIEYHHMPGSET